MSFHEKKFSATVRCATQKITINGAYTDNCKRRRRRCSFDSFPCRRSCRTGLNDEKMAWVSCHASMFVPPLCFNVVRSSMHRNWVPAIIDCSGLPKTAKKRDGGRIKSRFGARARQQWVPFFCRQVTPARSVPVLSSAWASCPDSRRKIQTDSGSAKL